MFRCKAKSGDHIHYLPFATSGHNKIHPQYYLNSAFYLHDLMFVNFTITRLKT